ncbi:MAG TPA: DUF3459 domain-containing protein, partial [Terriglobales bacterium]|nr:DUF3459 domain-containing protein [Terriglobales bacterium]
LDVVYNHFGPDGCYLREFSPAYFTDRYKNEWGESINFDGPDSQGVREFFVSNAEYWIREFHFDGLRLDATHRIIDSSPRHIISEVGEAVRRGASQRATIVVAETETQESFLARPLEQGGCGLDALWNDDYHHSAMVALTGRIEGYYSDFRGTPQELISALKFGFLFQGQWHKWLKQRRGMPSRDLDPAAFVIFLENHDQVSNSADGKRLHLMASPGGYRALTCLTLLAPATPMLFQGQEFAASSPFVFFADHESGLAKSVRKGRMEFLTQFGRAADPKMSRNIPDPADPQSFESCRIKWLERERNLETYSLHCDLLRLRREDPVFALQKHHAIDGAVLAHSAFVLRLFGDGAGDRLIIVNLGHDLRLESVAEPLMAPSPEMRWELLWSSEDPRYGGSGTPPVQTKETWNLPAEAAVVLKATAEE